MKMDMDQVLKEMVITAEKNEAEKPLKFVAYVNQGEGCDYMISCGKTLWQLEALTYDDAIEELKEKAIGEDGYHGEYKLEAIVLFEVTNVYPMPIDTWYSDIEKVKETEKAKAREQIDRMEFERLKRKYG